VERFFWVRTSTEETRTKWTINPAGSGSYILGSCGEVALGGDHWHGVGTLPGGHWEVI